MDIICRASNPDLFNYVKDVARRQWFVFMFESPAFSKDSSFWLKEFIILQYFSSFPLLGICQSLSKS